ncbi:MAG: FkbM family methyltransferase, partial [Nitrospirae bacterium]|nr:FkbM family methyltransferase [Nitrospirota bacterium]
MSLDNFIIKHSINDVDFIKMDTQGTELSILKGCTENALKMTIGLKLEVSFIEIYENTALFRDVDGFLYDNGFRLMDILRVYWKLKDYYDYIGKGQLTGGDALYFKDIDIFYKELSELDKNQYNKNFYVNKIYKGILLFVFYNMFDYAFTITKKGFELGYLTNIEFENISKEIKNLSKCGSIKKKMWYKKTFNWFDKQLQR